jgi:hypothetical protein
MTTQQPTPTPTVHYLRQHHADGHITTDYGPHLADETPGTWTTIEATVETVTAPAHGTCYAILTTPTGPGRALAILDARDHTEALGWMQRQTVRLTGQAATVLDQPGIDLRRPAVTG